MPYIPNKKRIIIASIILFFLFWMLFFPRDTPLQFGLHGLKQVTKFIKGKTIATKDVLRSIDFSGKNPLNGWKNKVFQGKSSYVITEKAGEKFLDCKSEKTSSALYHLVSYDSKNYPVLIWKWRPVKFPNKEGVTDPKLLDDYVLRLDVMFASGFFTNFKCIEYVWDEKLKEGTKISSPYSDKIMQLVVRSGYNKNEWAIEERNIFEDYVDLFGEKPKLSVRALAIMSDSEGSKDSSEGNVKEITIGKKL